MHFLYHLPLIVSAAIAVVFSILLSLLGLWIFHHFADKEHLREAHDVAGFVYGVVGVIYAVLLAFVVVVVWEQFRGADEIAENEAMHLVNVRQLARVFPDSISKLVSAEVNGYAAAVIQREWPAMSEGHSDSTTYAFSKELWSTFYHFRPAPEEQAYYNEALRELTSFNDARRERIIGIKGTIPPILWTLLVGGGIICIAFTYLFATPRAWTQYMITGLLAAMIAVTLFLIFEMDHPYRGGMSLEPDGFKFALHGPAPAETVR